MLPSLSDIYPTTESSIIFDVLSTNSICDVDNSVIAKLNQRHLFAKSIQFFSTNPRAVDSVKEFLTSHAENEYFFVKDMPIYALIEPNFLENFVRKGNVSGLSVNSQPVFGDTFALLPNDSSAPPSKTLLLSLTAETYYKLGLIGHESALNRTKSIAKNFRVEIDLLEGCFKPEKRNYQRTYECLKRSGLVSDFIIKFQTSETSPNCLESYFRWLKTRDSLQNMEISVKCPQVRIFQNRHMKLFDEKINIEDEECQNVLYRFMEWSAGQFCQIEDFGHDYQDENVEDISATEVGTHCVELQGFFSSQNILAFLKAMKSATDSSTASCVIVHGFEEAPQCWAGKNVEHHSQLDGDNFYGIASLAEQGVVCSFVVGDEYDYGIERL